MRLSHRLIGCLVVGVALVSGLFAWNDVRGRTSQLRADLLSLAVNDANNLEQALAPVAEDGALGRVAPTAERVRARGKIMGVIVFDRELRPITSTRGLPETLRARMKNLAETTESNGSGQFVRAGDADVFIYAEPMLDAAPIGAVAVVRDATAIGVETGKMWRERLTRVVVEVMLVGVITLLLVRWSFIRPMARMAKWLEERRLGRGQHGSPMSEGEFIKPLLQEVTRLVTSLESARASAEEEARLRDAGAAVWTAERLRAHVRSRIQEAPLFVVSNREPYMHVRRNGTTEVMVPASGVVTALEPVLRACNGTWIAHGSGNADREYVDTHDRVRVPPEQPEYSLRRVWLSSEEEDGYYYGFSNEGLWPLCHIAHTRPLFRAPDWACYQEVNRRFADAVIEEMDGTEHAMVLVQDYHFALLPRLIKMKRPDARVGVFWHIPWPNAEAFGICPWQSDLLDGLLGADLIGFHTQAHCNNFLQTVDRAFESQIEWEHFTARRHDHVTAVRPFPISVAGGPAPAGPYDETSTDLLRTRLLKAEGVSANFLGIGVDRVDYTKGILERFRGLERFFEKWDRYLGQFTFVQIGAPSRTHVKRYQDLLDEVIGEAARINARFATGAWKPIVLLTRHHSHEEIEPYYQAADFCLVTSLHDGMNLVAKEFVSARHDEDGVLILSQFAGASRELSDAMIVNPYDTEQIADAMRRAIEMDPGERRRRMGRMRRQVREHNVYRWAGTLIGDLADVRLTSQPRAPRAMAGDYGRQSGHHEDRAPAR